jgi:hypothetical protein
MVEVIGAAAAEQRQPLLLGESSPTGSSPEISLSKFLLCWSTLPSWQSMGSIRTVLHPAMGLTERVDDDVVGDHVGALAAAVLVGDAVACGVILERR